MRAPAGLLPTVPWGKAGGPGGTLLGVTWRLKSLCSSPFLGGAGGWPLQSRSGGTEPSSPKTFSSWKHSVSTICHRIGSCVRTAPRATPWSPHYHPVGKPHLVLPGDRHTARGKLLVEVLVGGLQLHTLHRGELFDVQDILTVNGLGLGGQRPRGQAGASALLGRRAQP